jgi:hypothetical protein
MTSVTQNNTKGYVFVICLFVFALIISWFHNRVFMKSSFYLKKIKTRPYYYELLFYAFVVLPTLIICIWIIAFLLAKAFNFT